MTSEEVHWDLWEQIQIDPLWSEWQYSSMIVKNLKIFSQNVCKNSLLVNTLLETLVHFDIILI